MHQAKHSVRFFVDKEVTALLCHFGSDHLESVGSEHVTAYLVAQLSGEKEEW